MRRYIWPLRVPDFVRFVALLFRTPEQNFRSSAIGPESGPIADIDRDRDFNFQMWIFHVALREDNVDASVVQVWVHSEAVLRVFRARRSGRRRRNF